MCNHLLDRGQRPGGGDRGRNDDPAGDFAANGQIRTQAENRRLQRQPAEISRSAVSFEITSVALVCNAR